MNFGRFSSCAKHVFSCYLQESRIYAVAKSGIRLSETSCTDLANKGVF